MHLNKEYRHPGHGELLVQEEVTDLVEAFLPDVPGRVRSDSR